MEIINLCYNYVYMHSPKVDICHLFPDSASSPEESLQLIENLVDQLSIIAEELQRQEKLRKPIPDILFHATPSLWIPNILQGGLIASTLPGEDHPVVCLSDSEEFAVEVASLTQQRMGKIALIEVDTAYLFPSKIINYLSEADDILGTPTVEEVRYAGDIPKYALTLK